ncbi:MAG: hypothetical protein HY710_03595 [Candidatus Latescibacteria bacterium]|nr:hypothetical protein [Candidatus Latescibacterota bacterium]
MRTCPKCQAEPVHQASLRWYDVLLLVVRWGQCPYQCDACHFRFWKSWTWTG